MTGLIPAAFAQERGRESFDREALVALMHTPVIAASKREQELLNSPQAIEVLTADQIRASGAFRLKDVLKLLTSVQVWEHPTLTRLAMRGVAPNGNPKTIQILVDGVPLYNSEFYAVDVDNLPVPIDLIERVEVVRGPSSSHYGANAQLGVVSITTRRAEEGMAGGARIGLASGGGFHSQAFVEPGSEAFRITAGAGGFSVRGSGAQPYSVGTGRPSNLEDAMRGAEAFLRSEYRWTDGMAWALYGMARKRGTQEDIESVFSGAPLVRLPQQGPTTSILAGGWSQSWSPTFRTQIRLQESSQEYWVAKLTASDPTNPGSVGAFKAYLALDPSFNGDYTYQSVQSRELVLQANGDPSESLHWVFGWDARRMYAPRTLVLGLREDQHESGVGGFLALDGQVGAWTLGAGARVENETLGGSRVSPRVTALRSLGSQRSVRFGVFTSTRSPQMVEEHGYPSTPAATTIPNPDLRPEKALNYEMGFRQATDLYSLDLTLFQTRLRGFINNVGTGRTTVVGGQTLIVNQYQNTSDATERGVEATAEWAPGQDWRFGLNGTYCRYIDEMLGTQADYAPREQGALWVRGKSGDFRSFLALQYIGPYGRYSQFATTVLREESKPVRQIHWNLSWDLARGLSLSCYGINGAEPITYAGNFGIINAHLVHYARREWGLQVSWRY